MNDRERVIAEVAGRIAAAALGTMPLASVRKDQLAKDAVELAKQIVAKAEI